VKRKLTINLHVGNDLGPKVPTFYRGAALSRNDATDQKQLPAFVTAATLLSNRTPIGEPERLR